MKETTEKIIEELGNRFSKLVNNIPEIKLTIEALKKMYFSKNKVLICGNGGSATDSLHIVGELGKGFVLQRNIQKDSENKLREFFPKEADYFINNLQEGVSAISLVNEIALMTAYGNDKNSELIFAQQVYVQGKENDILFAISTSGNSKNIINAIKIAKIKGIKVISLTGRDGGEIKKLSDINININEKETFKIQEYHLPIYHNICLALENELFGKE
ncbi:Phosphoheptose isomerase [Fusobacterium necrogenes]|uniref:Phosphoheptose isomerase n=1 Tax=Fusobacterium necrogenes TaxID=858 RepID=A0A377GV41_9FUSO|nr:SIS domain-containing protein [Fusobacterium necrogenes]STO30819.1 Phosphoheptose isomerase [Fusobacterium necrogenes]